MSTLVVGTENNLPIELAFTDQGAGQPVVLIHGWPLSGRSWEAQVPALIGAGYRVITYDRRGFGASSQPWEGYDYDTFAADLAALLDHLDLNDAVLIGFSMGGGEIARYLGTYGSRRIAKVVFASAVPPYLYVSDDNPDGGLDDKTLNGMLEGARGDRMAFLDGFMTAFFSAGQKLMVSDQQKAYALSIAAIASPKGTADCIVAFGTTDFRADLATITVPTLVIHGDSDATVPFEVSGERTAKAIPGAQLVVIKNGPHGVITSHPQEWNAAVLGFLAS
jgi:non-heme chloroperoxidase